MVAFGIQTVFAVNYLLKHLCFFTILTATYQYNHTRSEHFNICQVLFVIFLVLFFFLSFVVLFKVRLGFTGSPSTWTFFSSFLAIIVALFQQTHILNKTKVNNRKKSEYSHIA